MRLLGWLASIASLGAQTPGFEHEETVVIAERLGSLEDEADFPRTDLLQRSPLSLDQVLLEDPSFSLFRRQDATFANPTAAGVSLRRTGATATARTLVLRDGIPQNDPFGGWISWLRYRPGQAESVRLVPSARATAWGNQSSAGTIQIVSTDPWQPLHESTASFGSRETWSVDSTHRLVNNKKSISFEVSAFALQSDGHRPLASAQRGEIDRSLSLEASGFELGTTWRPRDDFQLQSRLSVFEEERGNGTALTRNATEALDFSLRATWEGPRLSHQATGYYQRRDFASVFTSQAADRASERVALDQFDVPGTGIGGSFTSRLSLEDDLTLSWGVDARHLDGETNERVTFDNRVRTAGGEQTFLGIFSQVEATLPGDFDLNASVRLDYYQSRSGSLREVLPDGSLRRDETFPDREHWEPSFGLNLAKQANDSLHLSIGLSSSFRAPTLNELYRGFRVRNDITNANADLDPERFYSAEAAVTWTLDETLEWQNTLFGHHITDAIANVPLILGADRVTAQRLNVETARVFGLESRLQFAPCETLEANLAYQWTESEFADSDRQPLLEGLPFPHSPRHRLTASLDWQALPSLRLGAFTTFSSSVYDDALASRRLSSYWSTSISAEYRVNESLTLLGRVDNLFDEDLETGLSSNGLLSLGAPRTFSLTARYRW